MRTALGQRLRSTKMDRRWGWLMAPCQGLFRAIVVLFFIFLGHTTTASSFWSYNRDVVLEKGLNLSVTCTVEGIESFLDVIRITHIQDSHSRPISDNGDVKSPYSQLPRYNVTYKYLNDKVTVTVSYRGIQPEDSGRLKCEKRGSEETSFLNITVMASVTDLHVIAISSEGVQTQADDETVFLEENKKLGVGCIAKIDGTVKVPGIRVSIGDNDVTSSFSSTAKTTTVDLPTGLKLSRTEASVVLSTDRPNPDFNGKDFLCTVDQSESEASSILSVKFAPVIVCSNSEWKARIGDHVNLRCDVKANPSSSIDWNIASESDDDDDDDDDEELADQENVIFNKTIIGNDQSRVEMTITHIRDSQFRKYLLKAENEIGTRNVTLAVIKKSGPVAKPSRNPDAMQNRGDGNAGPLAPQQKPVIHQTGNGANRFQNFEPVVVFQVLIMSLSVYGFL